MNPTSRCTSCDIALDADAVRCPRCLRKSTVLGKDGERRPNRDLYGREKDPPVDEQPSHVGVRVFAGVIAYAVLGPLTFWLLQSQAWFEARALWLPACFAALALGTLPLRMAVEPPERPMSTNEAARVYAMRMAAVPVMAAGMFAAQAAASRVVTDVAAQIFVGLLFFLLPLLVIPTLVVGLRQKQPIRTMLTRIAKAAGIAVAVVAACIALVALRSPPETKTIVIPENPKALLDPLDLESVHVNAASVRDANGKATLHLQADGDTFEQSLQKLSIEALLRAGKSRGESGASGVVELWLPRRFDSPENRKAASDEEKSLNESLSAAKLQTTDGQPIHAKFEFGDAPIP